MLDRPANREFDALLSALCDGSITDDQAADLNRRLASDPEARAAYLAYVDLHTNLANDRGVAFSLRDLALPERKPAGRSAPLSPRERAGVRANFKLGPALAFAAALLLTAAVVVVYVFVFNANTDPPTPQPGFPVATLVDSTGTVVINEDLGNPGSEYAAGRYAIDGGTAQFVLTNRVSLTLRGATKITVHSDTRATLDRGEATFRCPAGTEGYTVVLPGGVRVVDLGTEFQVTVNESGDAELRVFDGAVELRFADGRRENVAAGAGWAIAADGEANPIVDSIDSGARSIAEREYVRDRWDRYNDSVAEDPALVAHYRFEDSASPDQLYDSVSRTHHGSVVGARWDEGRLLDKRSLRFGGADSDDRVTLDDPRLIDGVRGAFTIAVWFRAEAFDADFHTLAIQSGSPAHAWRLVWSGKRERIVFNTGSTPSTQQHLSAKTPIDTGHWHLAVITYSARGGKAIKRIYLDGRLEGQATSRAIAAKPGPIVLGANPDNTNSSWNGWIDEFLVLNRAMSANEVKRMYQATRPQR